MSKDKKQNIYELENKEWLDSLDFIIKNEGPQRVREILEIQLKRTADMGIDPGLCKYDTIVNTISSEEEKPYPGDREIERKIKSLIRWNAMAMVVQANNKKDGIGGHISTYASAATLYEVGFNHFFRGGNGNEPKDIIYFQGHASPGIYARSFLEGRLNKENLENFRREMASEKGLSSYPHPRLMENYWQFPSVSMGLSPIMAIYQARFNKYMNDKGLADTSGQKIWAFLGDGEMDKPESMGALTLAAREELDNLIFVINCNLQRLDGPVRGNGSIIKELSKAFRGAGWNVIKVLWGENWDPLFKKDKSGLLKKRLEETVDGELQKYSASDGKYIRENFFGKYDELIEMVKDMSDEEIADLRRGGHDPVKVYNAYKAAVENEGSPTVILAQTIKGYGMGEAGEGRNITHQQKKLNEEELHYFRKRFDIPIAEDKVISAPFYRPDEKSKEIQYLKERRKKLGGFIPERINENPDFGMPENALFNEFLEGSGKREVATTGACVHLISKLIEDKQIGKKIVPIVPDEARTFGMDALFKQAGIYSHKGQLYEPVDREHLLYYKEAKDGGILEEGITEAGCMSSFIAAGTSYSTHQIHCIPFFMFYSMFGFQRIGDLIWAAADARARGFLIGGTSGRTTLLGEGLQHQDGQSHLYAMSVPCIRAYDPAYAYELAVIIKEGLRRMYAEGKDEMYYITVMNEKYNMPALPKQDGIEEDIINGMYKFRSSENNKYNLHLLGSGTILIQALKAADILKKNHDIDAEVWSVTSYKKLYDDAMQNEHMNRLNPNNKKENYIEKCVGSEKGVFIASSDYVKAVPLSVSKWFPGEYTALGTDGFGLSEDRENLRRYFGIDAENIVYAALEQLTKKNKFNNKKLEEARKKYNLSKDKPFPGNC